MRLSPTKAASIYLKNALKFLERAQIALDKENNTKPIIPVAKTKKKKKK